MSRIGLSMLGRPMATQPQAASTASTRTSRSHWIATLAAFVIAVGCSDPVPPPGRVLLVGIDGATMRVIEPMLAAGRLPTLGSIARQGVHGKLRSQTPIDSPPVWNTIVTGMIRRKHGIPSFAYKGEDGEKHLYLSTDRKVPALWNIVSAAGHSVGVVNFWNTYPPDRIDGVMISDHVLAREVDGRAMITHAPVPTEGTVVHPETWAERIDTLLGSDEPLTDTPNPFRNNEALPHWVLVKDLIRRYEEDVALARFALDIERELQPDLLMVLLPGIDRVSHHLWGTMESPENYGPRLRPTDEERSGGRKALFDYYHHVDGLIGALSAGFGPNDLVLVVSDHGFEAGQALMYLTGKHETEDAIDGVLFARGRGIAPTIRPTSGATVNDITPTILAWFGIPIGQDMDGSIMRFLDPAKPPTTIASHQDTPIEKVTSAPSGVEDDIIERLRMIGYLQE